MGCAYAQRACAACAVTNTVAYAQACESALGLAPDRHLRRARTLLLELERLYNHLNDISAICAGVGFAPGAMAFAALKERAQRLNQRLTGHRFLFDTVALASSTLRIGQLRRARRARGAAGAGCRSSGSSGASCCSPHRCRTASAMSGSLTKHDALRLGAVGPSARAAGVRHDTRSESPRLALRRVRARRPGAPKRRRRRAP